MHMYNAGSYVETSARTSDTIYVWVARWYAFSRCRRTDGDCVRFRVDRRLIDMNQDRKNQRDQTQPRYTQVGPQLFHTPRSWGIILKIHSQVKSGYSVVLRCLICERYHSIRIVIIKMGEGGAILSSLRKLLFAQRTLYSGMHTISNASWQEIHLF